MKKILVLFLALLMSFSVNSQVYEIDAVNGQTITTCGGTFYDSGGLAGNYADGENYRVAFCSTTGVISINFPSMGIEVYPTIENSKIVGLKLGVYVITVNGKHKIKFIVK